MDPNINPNISLIIFIIVFYLSFAFQFKKNYIYMCKTKITHTYNKCEV